MSWLGDENSWLRTRTSKFASRVANVDYKYASLVTGIVLVLVVLVLLVVLIVGAVQAYNAEPCPAAIVVKLSPQGKNVFPANAASNLGPGGTIACRNGAPVMCPVGYTLTGGQGSTVAACVPVAPATGPVVDPICPACPLGNAPACPAGFSLQGTLITAKNNDLVYVVQCVEDGSATGGKPVTAAPLCTVLPAQAGSSQ
jgi:hypothetical protein